MGTIQRCLGNIELAHWTTNIGRYRNAGCFIEYSGELDIDELKRAAYLLTCRYPALRANIIKNGECETGYSFVLPETEILDFTIKQEGLEEILEHLDRREEHARQERAAQSLFEVVVHRGRSWGLIHIGIHHVLGTANTWDVYISELFKIYKEIIRGKAIEISTQPFPKSAESFYADEGLTNSKNTQINASNPGKPGKVARRFGRTYTLRLSDVETAALISSKRESGVNFASTLSSCMAIALRNSINSNLVSFLLPIDWTRRTGKAQTSATIAVSNHIVNLELSANEGPIQLSKRIHENIRRVDSPSKDSASDALEGKDGPDIVINNGGPFLQSLPHIEGLELQYRRDINEMRWRSLQRSAGELSHPKMPKFMVVARTFDKRLHLQCKVRADIEEAAVIDHFMDQLQQVHRGRRSTLFSIDEP